MLALYIAAAVLVFFIILSLIPINAIFAVSFEDKLDGLEFLIRFMFVKIRILPSAPSKKKEEKKEETEQPEKKEKKKPSGSKIDTVRKVYALIAGLSSDIEKVLARLFTKVFTIHDFSLEARIGTEDAMYTGLAVGAANAFVYPLLGTIDHSMKLKRFNVNIIPDWNKLVVSGAFYTRISTTIASVLRLAIMLIPIYFKFRKIIKSL